MKFSNSRFWVKICVAIAMLSAAVGLYLIYHSWETSARSEGHLRVRTINEMRSLTSSIELATKLGQLKIDSILDVSEEQLPVTLYEKVFSREEFKGMFPHWDQAKMLVDRNGEKYKIHIWKEGDFVKIRVKSGIIPAYTEETKLDLNTPN